MIYTTYLAKLKDIPSEAVKIFIARNAKKPIIETLKKYDCIWFRDFGPSQELHQKYTDKEIPWIIFQAKYILEQDQQKLINPLWNKYIESVKKASEDGKDVYFICYERDWIKCHRTPFRELVTAITNVESMEADFSEINKRR